MQATLTLPGTDPIFFDLSESAYHDALALPPQERSRVIAEGIRSAVFAAVAEAETEPVFTEEDYTAIGRGLADMDAGRTRPAADVFAEIRARYGFAQGESPI
ncbi:MAG: hypothetical protein H8F28_19570 [Fibrella sp.]|nr:hypothetical protein [Armatimonadota bacterium]